MAHLDHFPLPEFVGVDDACFVPLADEVVEIADAEAALAAPAERYGCACGIVLAAHHCGTVRVLFGQHDCFHDLMCLLSVVIRFVFDWRESGGTPPARVRAAARGSVRR